MNLCSVVVHARPERLAAVRAGLAQFAGVEIHADAPGGKLVVTVEGEGDEALADTLAQFNYVEGVLNTVMIYHYCGDESTDEEVLQ